MLVDKWLIVIALRSVCFILFLTNATWSSLLYLVLIVATFCIKPLLFGQSPISPSKPMKTRKILDDLYPQLPVEEEEKIREGIVKLVSYNVEDNRCLSNFELIKTNSNCVFARKAKLWACPDWDDCIGLEGNIFKMLPMFLKFTIVCSSQRLDGFLLELPGKTYGTSVQAFGDGLRQVLKQLSDKDPAGICCMNKSYTGKRGWVFEFNRVTFFITTFAPFYPETHARYAFGAENCYILFQPELSFAFHDLPADTPHTQWEQPKTVRDKIRVAFKQAGRPYSVPESVSSPMALEMLRPISEGDSVYEWWKPTPVE